MEHPRVAVVVRNPVTYDARVLRTAGALRDAGAQVTVVGLLDADHVESETREGIEIRRVTPGWWLLSLIDALLRMPLPPKLRVALRRALRKPRRSAYAWAFQKVAAREMASVRPAVYHCNDIHTAWTGILADRRHRAPFIYDAHEIYAHQHLVARTLRRRMLVWFTESIVLRRCAAAITVNDSLAAWYARAYKVARPTVVRNVPDVRPQAEMPDAPHMPDAPTILYVGSITSGRGIETAVAALGHLPDVHLALLGRVSAPAEMRKIEATIERYGVGSRVHMLGPVRPDQVVQVASRATVGLVLIEDVGLSYHFSLPNKLFECAHAGLPVVASDLPEIRAVVEGYGTGLICDPSDPLEVARAIRRLLEDAALREGCVQGARAAAARFRWDVESESLIGLYGVLLPGLRSVPSRPRVAMVVRNAILHDARVLRCARALSEVADVTIFGERRKGSSPGERIGPIQIERIQGAGLMLTVVTKLALLASRAGAPGRRIRRSIIEPMRVAARAYAFQTTAARHMAALKPAVYHCHDFNTVWAGVRARRIHRAPMIYDAHELYAYQSLPRFTRRRRLMVRLVERYVIRRAGAVISANDSFADRMHEMYGGTRATVVRNVPEMPDGVEVDIDAERPQPPVLLYLGAIVDGRGIPAAIRAVAQIDGVVLRCVGPVVRQQCKEDYKALARELGVSDRVTIEPPVPPGDVVAFAAEATIGLCLIEDVAVSYRLSLPNKLFECMHAGLPLVGSDLPEIRRLIDRHGFGLTADPEDTDSVVRALRTILSDEALARKMRENALAAAKEHTWEKEAAIIREVFDRVTSTVASR